MSTEEPFIADFVRSEVVRLYHELQEMTARRNALMAHQRGQGSLFYTIKLAKKGIEPVTLGSKSFKGMMSSAYAITGHNFNGWDIKIELEIHTTSKVTCNITVPKEVYADFIPY